MSDSHLKQRWSPKGLSRHHSGGMASILSRRSESDADRAISSSDSHHQHEYRHASRWLPDCRLGFPECRLGFPECRLGFPDFRSAWRNALEEPLSHLRTALACKRHQSVQMLLSLLSSLTILPESSYPCVSRQGDCKKKLPLSAEPDDCETKSPLPAEPEPNPPANMVPCEPVASHVVEVWEDSPPFAAPDEFASSSNTHCEKAFQDTGVSLGDANESSLQTFAIRLGDANKSSLQTFDVSLGDANESSLQTYQTFGGKFASSGGFSTQTLETYSEPWLALQHTWVSTGDLNELAVMSPLLDSTSREEQYPWNSIGTRRNKNAAIDGVSTEGVHGSFRLPPSRAPRWDDWWTCQLDECNGQGGYSVNRRVLGHELEQQFLAPAALEQAEEEDSEEGYLILDEHEGQKEGRIEANDDDGEDYDGDDKGNTAQAINAKQDNDGNDKDATTQDELVKEGHGKEVDGGICAENISKACKEDDIWSDEDLISSQVKGFPPPISILANETHPGLPGHMPRTFWRSVKRGGRFVLQEVQAQPQEFFQATRENGRLRLQLVRPDSDPVGSVTETLDTLQPEVGGTEDEGETSGAGPGPDSDFEGSVTETPDTLQPELGGTEDNGETSGTGGQNGTNQISEKMLGVRTPLDAGQKETMDQIGTDQIIERKEISGPGQNGANQISEKMLGARTALNAGQKEITDQIGTDQIIERKETSGCGQDCTNQISEKVLGVRTPFDADQKETMDQIGTEITERKEIFGVMQDKVRTQRSLRIAVIAK